MVSLTEHIARRRRRPEARPRRAPRAENVGDVQRIRSRGLQAATVAFSAGVDLEERAARMNAFWRALVDLQFEDVVVVALCAKRDL